MFNIPVVFIIYNRLETAIRVFNIISEIKPTKLYVIADGPKNTEEKSKCILVRDFVENKMSWNCELVKVYSDENLGSKTNSNWTRYCFRKGRNGNYP